MAWTDPPTFTGTDYTYTHFNTYMRDNLLAQGEGSRCISIDPTLYRDVTSGGWTVATDVTPPNDPYGYGLSHGTLGDYVTYTEYLTPGQWRCCLHVAKRNDYGTLSLIVTDPNDASVTLESEEDPDIPGLVGEFNLYTNNATAQFSRSNPVDFTVTEAGFHNLKLQILGKDINSSGTTVRLFAIWLQKMSDLETSPVVWTAPRTWTSGQYVSSAQLETHLRDNLRMSGPFPRRSILDVFTAAGTSGFSLQTLGSASGTLGIAQKNTAQNDYIEWDVVLPAGSISVTMIVDKDADQGIITLAWDGVNQGTYDTYNAATQTNQRGVITFSNSTAKKAKLRLTMATKNASSSGYVVYLHRIVINYDNSAWIDPVHIEARELTTTTDFNNGWKTPMQQRGEMPWIIDIDPLVPSVDNNGWDTYEKDDDSAYFCGLRNENATHLPGYDGFWVEWDVPLAAGTYSCSLLATQSADAGQIDISLDGTEVVTNAEFYHASAVISKLVTTTSIVVADTKTYRVRATVNSKNASSSGFYALLNRIRFRRTS